MSENPAKKLARKFLPPIAARMFDSAKVDRLTASWGTTPLTADDIVRRNQRALVARSREQAANNDYMRAFLRMCRQNIVGPSGVTMQAQIKKADGKMDQAANDAQEAAWCEWGKGENCDVTGRQSWRLLQDAAITSAAKDGEYFFLIITGADAGPWGFSLQVIDPQRCPVDFDDMSLKDGRFIRQGIEFNLYGRPVAYWFTATEEKYAEMYRDGRGFQRVPAESVIHGFVSDIVGQKRGIPWAATSLWRLKMLNGFENAALVNARVSAAKGGFFEWQEGFGPEHNEGEDLYMEAEPGAFQELPQGVKFKEWNPQYPNGEFAMFQKSMLRGSASGMGVAYNNLANDLEGVNFSSIRQGALDEREHWKELQEWLIESLHERVHERWLKFSLLAQKIKMNGRPLRAELIDSYRDISWQPRRWTWIDPHSDVEASIKQVQNLQNSPGQIIREQGNDPGTVWRKIANDIEEMKAAGIPENYIQIALGLLEKKDPNAQQQQQPKNNQ